MAVDSIYWIVSTGYIHCVAVSKTCRHKTIYHVCLVSYVTRTTNCTAIIVMRQT